jgi:putative oxidoreductase
MMARWHDLAALPLRVALGIIFLVHGAQKLFGLFGGPGLSGVAEFLASLGLVPGMFWAFVAGVLELVGGAALLLGLLTRWVALALALEMAVSLVLVHLPAGFAAAQGGAEFPLALIGGLLSLFLSGAQRYALDARLPARLRAGMGGADPREARATA